MITSAEIQNFRSFQDINLSGLARINIIVGDNGSGKTSLLEALFLASASSPQIAFNLRSWRGLDTPSLTGTPQDIYDGMFLDLFYNFKKDTTSLIKLDGTAGYYRLLRFFYDKSNPSIIPYNQIDQQFSFSHVPITFEWTDDKNNTTKITPDLRPSGIAITSAAPAKGESTFFAARAMTSSLQNAIWFSELSKLGKEKQIVTSIQKQFNDVESITVEIDMGKPLIFIKFLWIERKIPIYLASDGLSKLVTILIFIAHSQSSSVFIDEAENGLHFSRHDKLWEQLLEFSKLYQTQIFLTTHSWEYLNALAPLINKYPDEFAMIQVFKKGGTSQAIVVPGEKAGSAIEHNIDVRG